ncbi:MAG: hypothetical protein F6K55_09165 [Moorea sp. SIO4A3]|nr:hypothetical protein [Moorena sp. SIO4A3]
MGKFGEFDDLTSSDADLPTKPDQARTWPGRGRVGKFGEFDDLTSSDADLPTKPDQAIALQLNLVAVRSGNTFYN